MSVGKLGKKLGVVHDPRTIKLKPLIAETVKAPVTFHIGHALTKFPMFGNDDYGDCTCAAHANRIVVQEYNTRQKEVKPTTEQVLAVYSAVTGFDKNEPATDNGAYMLDVLNYMRKYGLGLEKDKSPHMIYAFAQVDHASKEQVKVASYLFGGVYVGAGLPLSAADQINQAQRWDVVSSNRSEFGSWGGHAMHTVGYDDLGPIFITWGQLQRATWKWWAKYVDECYAVISEDWIKTTGTTTNAKLNLSQLQAQLAKL